MMAQNDSESASTCSIKVVSNTSGRFTVKRIEPDELEASLCQIWDEIVDNRDGNNSINSNSSSNINEFKFIPKQIFWMTGPPGAGKSHISQRIMKEYKLDETAYMNLSVLASAVLKDSNGILDIYKQYYLLFEHILSGDYYNCNKYKNGIIVDSFVRHTQHVHVLKFLNKKLLNTKFIILYIDVPYLTSVRRQMHRGQQLKKMLESNNSNGIDTKEDTLENAFGRLSIGSGEKNCPGNHGLKEFYTPNGSWQCSICQMAQNQNTMMFGCGECNYDLCHWCFGSNNNNKNNNSGNIESKNDNNNNNCNGNGDGSNEILLKTSDLNEEDALKRFFKYQRKLDLMMDEFYKFGNVFRFEKINANYDENKVWKSVEQEIDAQNNIYYENVINNNNVNSVNSVNNVNSVNSYHYDKIANTNTNNNYNNVAACNNINHNYHYNNGIYNNNLNFNNDNDNYNNSMNQPIIYFNHYNNSYDNINNSNNTAYHSNNKKNAYRKSNNSSNWQKGSETMSMSKKHKSSHKINDNDNNNKMNKNYQQSGSIKVGIRNTNKQQSSKWRKRN